jgi:GAF domain-containing protein
MNRHDFIAAALAADDDARQQRLVRSVVQAARGVFGAQACSVLAHDPDTDELVFEAVSGAGEDHLVGSRFAAGRGIAGWVLLSGETMIVDDLSGSPVFDREIAESTRYVPRAIMAAPLLDGDRVLGVMEVLDRGEEHRESLRVLDWLGLFAAQATQALALVQHTRQARRALRGEQADLSEVVLVAEAFTALPLDRRAASRRLLRAVADSMAAGG